MKKPNLLEPALHRAAKAVPFPRGTLEALIDALSQEQSEFEALLSSGCGESEVHAFLETHPRLLCFAVHNGAFAVASARSYLFSKIPLGDTHITDFVHCHRCSIGATWTFIEIEPPTAKLFTKAGDPSAELTHAQRQLTDWRTWLEKNKDYAERRLRDHLGDEGDDKEDWSTFLPHEFIVIIGRRASLTSEDRERRSTMSRDRVKIWTYDRLLRGFRTGKTGPEQLGYDPNSFAGA